MKYIAPNYSLKAFTCPHCHTLSQMDTEHWGFGADFGQYGLIPSKSIKACRCQSCGRIIIWMGDEYIYPDLNPVEPNPDMPEVVRKLYDEAGSIYMKSPRAACALLRLAVDQLCSHLGAIQSKIDDKIALLVKKGLSVEVQRALDIVRVVGNKAVHPGTIALDVDDIATANTLFNLINMIVDRMISEPKRIKELYASLPESTREAVSKRDQ